MEAKCLLPFAIKCRACKPFYDIYISKHYVFSLIPLRLGSVNLHFLMRYVKNWRALRHFFAPATFTSRCRSILFPKSAIPWEGNGGSGIIRDRHTKNCMSPVLRMRWK